MSQICAAARATIQKFGVLGSVLKLLHISKIVPVGLLEETKEREKGWISNVALHIDNLEGFYLISCLHSGLYSPLWVF